MILSKRSLNTGSKVLLVDDFMRGGGVLTGMESLMSEFDVDVVGKVIITQCLIRQENMKMIIYTYQKSKTSMNLMEHLMLN